jgi:hypothetical protein
MGFSLQCGKATYRDVKGLERATEERKKLAESTWSRRD